MYKQNKYKYMSTIFDIQKLFQWGLLFNENIKFIDVILEEVLKIWYSKRARGKQQFHYCCNGGVDIRTFGTDTCRTLPSLMTPATVCRVAVGLC